VQPVTQQWSLNLERQFGRDYSVTLGYLGVRGEHLTRTRDINCCRLSWWRVRFPMAPCCCSPGTPAA